MTRGVCVPTAEQWAHIFGMLASARAGSPAVRSAYTWLQTETGTVMCLRTFERLLRNERETRRLRAEAAQQPPPARRASRERVACGPCGLSPARERRVPVAQRRADLLAVKRHASELACQCRASTHARTRAHTHKHKHKHTRARARYVVASGEPPRRVRTHARVHWCIGRECLPTGLAALNASPAPARPGG